MSDDFLEKIIKKKISQTDEGPLIYIPETSRKKRNDSLFYETSIKVNKSNMEPETIVPTSRKNRGSNKLKFDWSADEDTSDPKINDAYVSNIWKRSKIMDQLEDNSTHWSLKELDQMRERDWRIFKEDFDITSIGRNCPNPLRSWEELDVSDKILDIIIDNGFDEPTPIQRQSIPIILKNRNLIGVSSTGSGKTFSFVLPIILKILQFRAVKGKEENLVLILAPNREIVRQVEQVFEVFSRHMSIRVVTMTGGSNLNFQSINFINGVDVVIATPNRLIECFKQHFLDLRGCSIVVFDEIDRLLEENYKEDFDLINSILPDSTLKIFFSATLSGEFEKSLVSKIRDPIIVKIKPSLFGVPHNISQRILFVNDENFKFKMLLQVIRRHASEKMLIFCNTKAKTILIANRLASEGIKACVLHGDSKRRQREAELASWKANISRTMVSTDMTSRGLDVEDLDIVLNYDMPLSITQYIHRIGRTGRINRKGSSITFIDESSSDLFFELKKIVSENPENFMDEKFLHHPACNEHVQTKKRDQKIFAYGT